MNVIKIKDLNKKFNIDKGKYTTLKEKILNFGKSDSREFWALKNVSLNIIKGETVGLIGRNGSGKSTLLKIMTKILYPTSGSMLIEGRVSSLLELGAGFHPDFTGRENIYMNASILGLSKREIDLRLNEIITFSELGEFIDRPVRVYSSGMYMRLAFSVAISVDPDILLIDEVLAVGDSAFQSKCFNKIKELKGQGKTIVIVTHDNGVVEKLCDKAVWLHEGEIREIGIPKVILVKYMTVLSEMENDRLLEQELIYEKSTESEQRQSINEADNDPVLKNRWGNKIIEIQNVELLDHSGKPRKNFICGDPMDINIYYKVNKTYENAVFGIGIFTPDNICCYGTNTYVDKFSLNNMPNKGVIKFKIENLTLVSGEYLIDVAVHKDNGEPYDYQTKQYKFQVSSEIFDTGVARQSHTWEVIGVKENAQNEHSV
jgi:ABC-type polysaccharide/polyol phosphate transport system ATPase subunit